MSFFQVKDAKEALKKIEDHAWEIKRELTHRLGKQLRRMPEIKYFRDETLEHVFKMEEIFKELKNKKDPDK